MKIFKSKTKKVIEKYIIEEDILISFDEIKGLPKNKVLQLDPSEEGSIEFTRLEDIEEDDLSFRVVMKRGKRLAIHHHDCEEKILLYKGKIKDLHTGREMRRAEIFSIPSKVPHHIESIEDSIFYVEFKNPDSNGAD